MPARPEPRRIRVLPEDPFSWGTAVEESAAALDRGEVVVLPAEGLYGYHARPDRPAALERLASLKPRDAGKGWIVLVEDPLALERWDPAPPPPLRSLAARYWPGALTLVVPAVTAPPSLRSGGETVAVRCPGSPFLRAVVGASGGALLSTSANPPGGRSPAALDEAALEGIPLAVDGGRLSGLPSTIAGVDGSTVQLLRKGAVRLVERGGDEP